MIPRHLHFIWYGPLKCPSISSWKKFHPTWGITVWRERDFRVQNKKLFDYYRGRNLYYGMSDIARVEILLEHGGVYMDIDTECVRSLDDAPFMKDEFWCVRESDDNRILANGMIGSVPRHPILYTLRDKINQIKPSPNNRPIPWIHTGPMLLTETVGHEGWRAPLGPAQNYRGITILPPCTFLPKHHKGNRAPDEDVTYAKHHWGSTRHSPWTYEGQVKGGLRNENPPGK